MASSSIITQHARFDDPRTVHPLRRLLNGLMEGIELPYIRSMVFLSKHQLGDDYDVIERLGDDCDESERHQRISARFFDSLEARLGTNDMVDFLFNLLEMENLHSDSEKYSARVNKYREEKEKYHRECHEQGILKDPNFVGREAQLKQVLDCIEGTKYKGVILCGLGGMGKTTLANEVCYLLKHGRQQHWTFHKVELREKSRCSDLYVGMLQSLEAAFQIEDVHNEAALKAQLLEIARTKFTTRRILFLDNADGLVGSMDTFMDLYSFMSELLLVMDGLGPENCKTKLLITVGQKVCHPDQRSHRMEEERFSSQLLEIELTKLSHESTILMLRRSSGLDSTKLSEEDCEEISELCGGSPMGLRIIGTMLRDGHSVQEIKVALTFEDSSVVQQLKIDQIMKRAYSSLDCQLQRLLVKLSLFQTAKFDLRAAVAIGEETENNDHKEAMHKLERKRLRKLRECQMKSRLLLLKHRHLIEFAEFPDERKAGKEISEFSLHPLVWKYLKQISKETELQCKIDEAKKRFLQHFCTVINECVKDEDQAPLKAYIEMEDNLVHIKQFYQFFIRDVNDIACQEFLGNGLPMVRNHRLKAIADLVLYSEQRKWFFRRQAERCKAIGNLYQYMYWRCEEANQFLAFDRLELAEQVLGRLEGEVGVVNVGSSEDGTEMAEVSGWQHSTLSARKSEQVGAEDLIPAVACYHAVKGGYYSKRSLYDRALDHAKVAVHLYNGDQITGLVANKRVDGSKPYRKTSYKRLLASAKNRMGEIYFKKGCYEEAERCHSEAHQIVSNLCKGKESLHPDLTAYLSNIAACHHQRGLKLLNTTETEGRRQLEKARNTYDKCISHDKYMKRDIHMTHAFTLRNRSNVLYSLGEVRLALADAKLSLSVLHKLVTPPNIDLTRAYERVALMYYKLGLMSQEEKDEVAAREHWEESLRYFDTTLIHITKGGLPIDHDDYRTYRVIRQTHYKLAKKHLNITDCDVTRIRQRYKDFELGKFNKSIQRSRRLDADRDAAEELRRLQAEGVTFQLEDCSDQESSSEEDTSDSSESRRSTTSSESSVSVDEEFLDAGLQFADHHRRDSGIEETADLELLEEDLEEREVVTEAKAEGRAESNPSGGHLSSGMEGGEPIPSTSQFEKRAPTSAIQKAQLDRKLSVDGDTLHVIQIQPVGENVSADNGIKVSVGSERTSSKPRSSGGYSSSSARSAGSQGSVTSMVGKLLTMHSRSFDEDVFIPASAADEELYEPTRKKSKTDS